MNQKTTLRILTTHLSGKGRRIFPNQVVFYHALFAFTQKRICPEALMQQIRWFAANEGDQPQQSGLHQIAQLRYIFSKSLDGNSGNIGKHINNAAGCPIPVFHKEHYLDENCQEEILRRLQLAVELFLNRQSLQPHLSDTELQELLLRLRLSLKGKTVSDTLAHATVFTPAILAHILYEAVQYHLIYETAVSLPPGLNQDDPKLRIDLITQKHEWEMQINGYGSHSLDRFLALQRLADSNVFAAEELANQYYYGTEYHVLNEGSGNNGVYRILPDYGLAARYFRYAADCIPHSMTAAWSFGYMLLNHLFSDIPETESLTLARKYLSYGLAEHYAPSINGLGNLEKQLGNRLLDLEARTAVQEEEMLAHFSEAVRFYAQASGLGWTYAHINLAEFFADPRYQAEVIPRIFRKSASSPSTVPIQTDPALCAADTVTADGSLLLCSDPLHYWRLAARQQNPWAMDNLAEALFAGKQYTEARKLWESTARLHYPDGYLKLACRFYHKDGCTPDEALWLDMLTQASDCGSAKASLMLADFWKETQPESTLDFLTLAEQQNFQKFNETLYQEIQALRSDIAARAKRKEG